MKRSASGKLIVSQIRQAVSCCLWKLKFNSNIEVFLPLVSISNETKSAQALPSFLLKGHFNCLTNYSYILGLFLFRHEHWL